MSIAKGLASKCCSAGVYLEMSADFIGDKPENMTIGTANYFCKECGKGCDTKIKFDEESVKGYLDTCIIYWRVRKKKVVDFENSKEVRMCKHYVDAYQSVRVSLFGETLS